MPFTIVAGRQSFSANLIMKIRKQDVSVTAAVHTVAAGRVLVVEFVSVICTAEASDAVVEVNLTVSDAASADAGQFQIVVHDQGLSGNERRFVGSQMIRAYAEAGWTLHAFAARNAANQAADITIRLDLAGYELVG